MAEGGKGDGPGIGKEKKSQKSSGKGDGRNARTKSTKGKFNSQQIPNWKMRFIKRISKKFPTEKPQNTFPSGKIEDFDINKIKPWSPSGNAWEDNHDSPLTPHEEDTDSSEWEEYTEQRNASVSASYVYHFDPEEEEEEDEVENEEKFFVPELNISSFKVNSEQITSTSARSHTKKQTLLGSRRLQKEFRRPRGSYLRCPEGGEYRPEKFGKRMNPGPFLTCPIPHEQGGLLRPFRMRHKINRNEMPTFRRPWYLRVRQPRVFQAAPFFKKVEVPLNVNCKSCNRDSFIHHKDPDQHYWDYVVNRHHEFNFSPVGLTLKKQFEMGMKRVEKCVKEQEQRNKKKRKKRKQANQEVTFEHVKSKVDTFRAQSFPKYVKKSGLKNTASNSDKLNSPIAK